MQWRSVTNVMGISWNSLAVAVAVLGALVLGLVAYRYLPGVGRALAPSPLSLHGTDVSDQDLGGPFSLAEASGRTISLKEFEGKAVIVTFGYTHCPEACPTTLARLAKARRLLGSEGRNLQVLFVSVDYKRDAGEPFGTFVRTFDPSFLALRGDDAELRPFANSFRAQYRVMEIEGEPLVDHTVDSYLIDASGHVRVRLPYQLSAADIADDVRIILSAPAYCSPWTSFFRR